MPYIKQEDRKKFDNALNKISIIKTKGELEYCIYKLMKMYMADKDFRYSTLHDTVYAAQHCADEFRRNYLDKRENQAKECNGKIEPLIFDEIKNKKATSRTINPCYLIHDIKEIIYITVNNLYLERSRYKICGDTVVINLEVLNTDQINISYFDKKGKNRIVCLGEKYDQED